jgi:serine/threonine protein phosphatase PrpC
MVADDEIQKIITVAPDIRDACKKLIQKANESGGEDNATVVLIKIEEAPEGAVDDAAAKSNKPVSSPPRPAAAAVKDGEKDGEDDGALGFAEEPTAPGVIPRR